MTEQKEVISHLQKSYKGNDRAKEVISHLQKSYKGNGRAKEVISHLQKSYDGNDRVKEVISNNHVKGNHSELSQGKQKRAQNSKGSYNSGSCTGLQFTNGEMNENREIIKHVHLPAYWDWNDCYSNETGLGG